MFDFLRGRKSSGNDGNGSGSVGPSNDSSANGNVSAGAALSGEPFAARRMAEVLASFTEAPLPDAVEGVLFRVSMAAPGDRSVSNFERFAARLLTEVGATSLRPVAVEHPIELRKLTSTGLFWASFDASAMTPEQRMCVLNVESALNRLVLAAKAAEREGVDEAASEPSEARYSQWDHATIRSIADEASAQLSGNESPNSLLAINGAQGARGGNWDVSTRFASACESFVLPYRLEYRFDVDASSGTVAANITLPLPSQMPRSRWAESAGGWQDCTPAQPAAASAYALRLTALVASAAFGASVGITRVIVNGYEGNLDGAAVLSLELSRMAFVMGAAPAIRGGQASAEEADCNPAALFNLLHPARFALSPDETGRNQPIEKLDAGMPDRRPVLAEDTRALPTDIAQLLHADRVCDLDVLSEQDADLAERFHIAMADRNDAPLLAIAQLEDIMQKGAELTEENLAEAKTQAAAAGALGNVTPLYCEGAFARYLVGLTDAASDPAARFSRASDLEQSARSALMQLYLDMGDAEGARVQAQACIDRAPSSPSAYQDLITVYADADNYEPVIDVAKKALRTSVLDDSIFYLYYRLAFAFWQTGRREEAAACYSRVPRASNMGDPAARELADLLGEMGGRAPMDSSEATATLRAAGVPVAPTDEACELMSKAMVGLCDAGFPLAAAPLASIMGRIKRNDVISATAASLREGV